MRRALALLRCAAAALCLDLGPRPVIFVTPPGWCASGDVARLVGVCEAAAAGGAAAVQLRDPGAPRAAMVAAGRAVAGALAASACAVVVNGDPALAFEARADGAHLPERLAAARGAAAPGPGEAPIAGCSAHSAAAALRAADLGAAYVQLGTMFATATHPGKAPEGPPLAAAVAAALAARRPPGAAPALVGVGGVDAGNAGALAAAGCDGVAVIRAVALADDPAAAVRNVRAALGRGAA